MAHYRVASALVTTLLFAVALRGESFTVRVQETAVVEIAGATAAYTTNPAIAEVATRPGRVALTGHSAGTTQLVVVTASGTQSFLITVAAPTLAMTAAPAAGVPVTRYDGRYSSAIARVQNSINVLTIDKSQRNEFHLLHIRDLQSGLREPSDSIASVFYRRSTPRRDVTLLDAIVDVSRMTVRNTQVRGVHMRQGPLELHAGYASSTIYDTFFLPTARRWVGGAGYDIDRGSIRWTPSVYGFFSDADAIGARRGVVAAISGEHRQGDSLFIRGDLGVSRSLAAAGEIRHQSARGQFRAFLSIKPDDFPTLGLAEIPGEHAELDWSGRLTDRLSMTSYGTFDRFELSALGQTIGAATVGLRYDLTTHLRVLFGADASAVRTSASSIRTVGLPLGLAYEAPAFGLAASYRLLDNSETSRYGDTVRLSGHAGRGRLSVNAFAERQRQAPTLDLIFRSEPGLELALLRLGVSVRTPQDVARALRDNAALIDLGFITGVNVDLTPRRLQAGLNVGWAGSGPRSNRLRLFAVYGRDEGISSTRENVITTLTYSRRVLAATDLYGAYSWFRTGLSTFAESGTSFELGLRQQFDGLPTFLQKSGTIEGFVFLDPEMRGARGGSTEPLRDIVVTLDNSRSARTDSNGAYVFRSVAPGMHRIAAQLPAAPRAFFTTPSHARTNGSAHVDFGLVWAAARLEGRVITDAGVGLPDAVVSVSGANGLAVTTTTDAEGRFVFAVPPGTLQVELATGSLTSGYALVGVHQRTVTVEPDQPQSVSFEAKALRSIAGKAAGASEVQIASLGRSARVDIEGNFVFRSMPSGTFTITGRSRGRAISTTVTLPVDPAMLGNVVLAKVP
jgi:hypothetical protein